MSMVDKDKRGAVDSDTKRGAGATFTVKSTSQQKYSANKQKELS